MQVRLFATLRQTAGRAEVEVPQAEGNSVRTVLARLVDTHPDLEPEIFDSDGELQSHIHIMVNGRDIRFLAGLDTPVQASDQMWIFPPVGGGAMGATQSSDEPAASPPSEPAAADAEDLTHVTLKFTGNVRGRMGCDRMEFAFAGHTLGDLLNDLFAQYDLRDLILEEGKVRPWARVAVNGRFSYLLGDMEVPIHDGDMVVLMHPYVVAF
jgi:molybdopterin synthase sulfur carrier subunit